MKEFSSLIAAWNKQTSSFSKLQHAYAALTIIMLIIAGIIGLINYRLGQGLLFLSLFSLTVFVANGVIWALVRTFIIAQPKKPTQTRKK